LRRDFAGYHVRPAINGTLALKAAQKAAPGLILLDVQMPGLDGYEVCRQLKAGAQTRAIPLIFISALDDVLDKVEAFQIGGGVISPSHFRSKRCWRGSKSARAAPATRRDRNEQLIALANDQLRPQIEQIAEWAATLRGGGEATPAEQIRLSALGLSEHWMGCWGWAKRSNAKHECAGSLL